MPAGSGPQVTQAGPVVLPANTTENVLCTLAPANWNAPGGLGNLLTYDVVVTGAAAGTITFRVRQGTTNAGAQVGVSVPVALTNGPTATPSATFLDQSAFAIGPQVGGQYVLTYQQSAVSLGTVNNAALGLETVAPVA